MNGITMERLEVLRKLRGEDGVLRAAGGSKSRQGLFSRQLRELEQACGTSLVDRAGRRLQLNQKGEAVVQRYEQLLEEIGVLAKADGPDPALRIGGGEVALVQGVIPLLGDCFDEITATLQFRNLRSADAIRLFRRGELDLVLSTEAPSPLRTEEDCRLLLEEGYVIVTPPEKKRSQGLFLKTLLREKLVILEGKTPIRSYLEREARKMQCRPRLGALCSTYGQILEVIVEAGFSGVIPSICGPAARERGLQVKRLISEEPPPFQLWVLYRNEDRKKRRGLGMVLKALRVEKA